MLYQSTYDSCVCTVHLALTLSYSTIVLYIRDIEGVGAIRDIIIITQKSATIFGHNDMTVPSPEVSSD